MTAWWRAEGDARDSAGSNHGALTDGATIVPGFIGDAFNLPGQRSRIVVPDNDTLDFAENQDFTIALWMNLQNPQAGKDDEFVTKLSINGNRTRTDPKGYYFRLQRDTHKVFIELALGPNQQDIFNFLTDYAPPLSTWTHLAITRRAALVSLFANGSLVGERNLTAGSLTNSAPLIIGGDYDTAFGGQQLENNFSGLLDEVRIYNRALPETEIRAVFDAESKAQDKTTVEGLVEMTNGSPVAGATVTIVGMNFSTVTAPDGRFSIPNVPNGLGPIELRVRFVEAGITFFATVANLTPVPRGITDAGTITVLSSPMASNQSVVLEEATSVHFVLTGFDVDGDPLTFAIVNGPSFGFISAFNPITGSLIYTPNPNFNGADSFTYKANDGQADSGIATVSVTTVSQSNLATLNATVPGGKTGARDAVITIQLPYPSSHGVASIDSDDGPTISVKTIFPTLLELQVASLKGSTCVIETSTDLRSWEPMRTNSFESGRVVVVGPGATNHTRFYRARLLP